ncbi:MAG: glycoside hydrolase family 3 C-terminal domain-containing protein [Bacteroidales bacterium]|nr:glycoside hydrolase family 3 C-terminal domain-containing protein [Bacteroidales bacterium]
MRKTITLLSTLCLVALNVQAQELKLSADNVEEVLQAMTIEEKAQLLIGVDGGMFKALERMLGGETSDQQVNMVGQSQTSVPGAAGATRAIPRLGIPATVLTDGPAGVRINPTREGDTQTYYCTGFPVGTVLASTWNTELVEQVGAAIGNEVLEYGCDVLLAPGMNIMRHPLCGRNFEYYSEDPLLTGKIAAAYVNGVQSQGVGTSAKHYAANSQEINRLGVDARVSQRALREIYLKNFEIVVKESQPWTIMSSYNRLNGEFTQESKGLLTDVLRTDWGFKGIVMTDWTPIRNTAAQVAAGNDLMEPGMDMQVNALVSSIKSGKVSIEDVDACCRRMLEYIVRTPSFKGYRFSNKPDLKAHAEITRQSATEGIVLLKNQDNTLPISNDVKIAVFGVSSYDFMAGGTGSGDVNKAYTVDMMEGLRNAGFACEKEIEELYRSYVDYQSKYLRTLRDYQWYEGAPRPDEMVINKSYAKKWAGKTDVAILTLGRQAGEGDDRTVESFSLTDNERQTLDNLCEAYHLAGKKVIVILNVGSSIETASWKSQPDAILCAWQTGQEGGNSVADILTGKANPSGKLTQTFPVSIFDVPASRDFPLYDRDFNQVDTYMGKPSNKKDVGYCNYEDGIYVGYRYFETAQAEVSYPFGFGLSYTTFAYSKPTIRATKDGFEASITISNTGNVAGKEVVQLYVTAPNGQVAKPALELKAFGKTRELKPGESQTIQMKVSNYDLASFIESESAWIADAGRYQIKFAAAVNDVRATSTYTLSKPLKVTVTNALAPKNPINEMTVK